MPKRKPDQVIVHRIELQEHEREALDMVAASITARNVTASIGNLVTPILGASAAGIGAALGLIAYFEINGEEYKSYGGLLFKFIRKGGLFNKPDTPEQRTEDEAKSEAFIRRLGLLRTSVISQINRLDI